ncbi:MAG: fumarylacetoacetate hydrolase family protein [Pseudomonadota bacterium]
MPFVIDPPAQPALPVTGTDALFPVRRIFCVGRNYAAHAREMGADAKEPPFFFMKPADAIAPQNAPLPFPPQTEDLHHEAELVVALGQGGRDILAADALGHVYGYAAGIDLTRRDAQAVAKEMRRPWDLSKGFDNSAAIGPVHPAADVGHLTDGGIRLTVSGERRQDGTLSDMIWPVADIIAFASGVVTLAQGDLIMTGTPAGVGPLRRGDTATVEIDGLAPFSVSVAG